MSPSTIENMAWTVALLGLLSLAVLLCWLVVDGFVLGAAYRNGVPSFTLPWLTIGSITTLVAGVVAAVVGP